VGLEEEVKKMEKETYFLKKMLDELSASTNNSVGIEEKIESLESQVRALVLRFDCFCCVFVLTPHTHTHTRPHTHRQRRRLKSGSSSLEC
jgi:hypothetical protein